MGRPAGEPYAPYMAGYSPYDNTSPPPTRRCYVTAGLNDPRVSYHEPAKWVAKLRADARPGAARSCCKHRAGRRPRRPVGALRAWRDEAQTLAFLFLVVGGAPE